MCCLGCAAVPGCVAHDAADEGLLAVVFLLARYGDRPWGWPRNEISCIAIDLGSFTQSALCGNHLRRPAQFVFQSR